MALDHAKQRGLDIRDRTVDNEVPELIETLGRMLAAAGTNEVSVNG